MLLKVKDISILPKRVANLFSSKQVLTKRIFDNVRSFHSRTLLLSRFFKVCSTKQAFAPMAWNAIAQRVDNTGAPGLALSRSRLIMQTRIFPEGSTMHLPLTWLSLETWSCPASCAGDSLTISLETCPAKIPLEKFPAKISYRKNYTENS
jgi:hypothetical protein